MENKYNLKISPQAKRDIEDIFIYIKFELQNETAALNLTNKLEKALLKLENMPRMCPESDNPELKFRGYRKCIVNNYIALYKIDDENKIIFVVKVFYSKRDYKNLGLY